MKSKRWSTGYTLQTSKTKRWSKEQIDRNNEIENKMIFEGFTPEDYGTGRKLVAHCESKEVAEKIVKCVNSHDELVQTLQDGLEIMNAHLIYKQCNNFNAQVPLIKSTIDATIKILEKLDKLNK